MLKKLGLGNEYRSTSYVLAACALLSLFLPSRVDQAGVASQRINALSMAALYCLLWRASLKAQYDTLI